MKVGFIGQGYIGKGYADDFESRGYEVVRYALEPEYNSNREKLSECDVVLIAVPTPSTPEGFDDHIVRDVLTLVGKGKIALIKSTLVPGTTKKLQEIFPDIYIFHSPEFLSRATAKEDAENPRRNIIGVAIDTPLYREKAQIVLDMLPKAPYTLITVSDESELIKYINNTFFYTKTVFMNLLYDVAVAHGLSWERIKEAMRHEPWIGEQHIEPVHRSGRGAGGPCLIKDFRAFSDHYTSLVNDPLGGAILDAIEKKNLELLKKTEKDQDLVHDIYGDLYK